ncbi:UDP-N-acetylmuramyl pentapeptide phosphotransferase/UDP-N-acetylglucosamine-1-phosphate transferase [Cyclobacterium lianum]|uniref:UDP-N-acetylmuramyl pentapeptide phosphotransferase/UDP-N-acetylglucosamine-1-phosphate transferase n=1 Tax=Cyclobacterium lianum TaxID=388280 RepID=A0A1M7PDU8_9BACT|nr:UDP-GlcNAc--UDP-phosphate GlcNAc-1-phosphate transferase [Cyclobacterium lianum]SHN15188.1 UDP-N-acetylmuramyl pentapeptide phosphotransferase/UDP-N-acetylglucosamine-1-phosphate transferase [Cyclobacterium lianum]
MYYQYPLIFVFFVGALLLYFRLASIFGIVDKPNERSSHTRSTIRGGGIVFVLSVVLAWLLGAASWQLALAILLVGGVSMWDDIRPLHQLPRISAHFLATALLLLDLGNGASLGLWVPLIFFMLIGWTNLFNFMDGINGITVLYALVSLGSFALVPEMEADRHLIIFLSLSCLAFAWFNVRKKAWCFAGDVGSVSLAMVLGYLMIRLIILTGNPAYLFFFTLYGLDAVITLILRFFRGENIFLPHRSHLYQYLANEAGLPHVVVAVAYAGLQLLINGTWMYFIGLDTFRWLPSVLFMLAVILAFLLIRNQLIKKIAKKNKKNISKGSTG